VLALRRKVNIKVRQPLSTLLIPEAVGVDTSLPTSIRDLVLAEVNIKEIKTISADAGFLVKRVKPDFKKLGPKFGKQMKAVAAAIAALDQTSIAALEREGSLALPGMEGAEVALADVEIISQDMPGWIVANEGNITVALDVTLTPELLNEGRAREIVNRIQNIRKSRDYDITDRVKLVFEPGDMIGGVLAEFGDYIGRQVLAEAVVAAPVGDASTVETLVIDDMEVKVDITLN
ncbi:MAG: isoleucine--tRNA ligase, partial [Muribaculaceae bacterium]|nr:isoleucine--tRNA ligase [Muribaculaceae bacterium]